MLASSIATRAATCHKNNLRLFRHGVVTCADETHHFDSPNEDGEGEIWVTGPNVMLGYYKDEATTAEAMDPEEYFKTDESGDSRLGALVWDFIRSAEEKRA